MMRSLALALLSGALLCGAAVTGQASAASPYDGVYRGTYAWAGNGRAHCSGGDMSVRVTDGTFTVGSGDGSGERVPVTVGPDGSFSAQGAGSRSLQGKIQGDQLTATLTAGRCNYLWSLKK